MTELALPCISCGVELENVDETAGNQPYRGTAFETRGHYGSTYFDPMDGSHLELNICDVCLKRLEGEGKIMFGRTRQPVVYDGLVVGWRRVECELTTYNGEQDDRHEVSLEVELEDIGTDQWDTGRYTVDWLVTREEVRPL